MSALEKGFKQGRTNRELSLDGGVFRVNHSASPCVNPCVAVSSVEVYLVQTRHPPGSFLHNRLVDGHEQQQNTHKTNKQMLEALRLWSIFTSPDAT